MINAFELHRVAVSGLVCKRNTGEKKEEERQVAVAVVAVGWCFVHCSHWLSRSQVSSTIYRGGEAISSMLKREQETVSEIKTERRD